MAEEAVKEIEEAPEENTPEETPESPENAAEAPETPEEPEAPEKDAAEPVDWRSLIQDEKLRKEAERVSSLDDAFKSIQDMKKQMSDRIKLPGKDADEKEVSKFRKALGVPEKAEDYAIELPEGVEMSETTTQLFEAIKPIAHENNLPAKALNDFALRFDEFAQQIESERQAQVEKHMDEAETALRKEWGGDYDANLNIANRAMAQVGGEEIAEFLNKTELKEGGVLANDPHMVRLFAKLGRRMSEDGAIEPVSKDEAKDLEEKFSDITRQIHEASAKGDGALVDKLAKERSAIAAKLDGDAPLVGAGGRTL